MNLYELSSNYQELLDYAQSVDMTDPEQAEMVDATLESLDGAIEDKAENIVHVLQQLKYNEEIVNKEIKRLQDKKRALINNQKRLTNYLQDTMEYVDKQKIESAKFTIWIQNNPPRMVVEDESHIPKEFYEEQQPRLNKKELRKYLDNNEVDGVRIEQGRGLRFR